MKSLGAGVRVAMAGLVALLCAGTVRPGLPAMAAEQTRAKAAPEAPLDTPDTIVASGVGQYTIAAPKLYWRETQSINCDPDVHTKTARDLVKRVALQGSTVRTLYDRTFTDTICNSQLASNIVADSDYLYWTTATALMKLPANAITQTNPLTLSTAVVGGVELVQTGDAVFALTASGGIRKTLKASGLSTTFVSAGSVGASPSNFQTDGVNLYWITANTLKRFPIAGGGVSQIGGAGVTGYVPIFNLCIFGNCPDTTPSGVFVAVGDVVSKYNVLTGAFMATLYTSTDNAAIIREVGVHNEKLVVLEDRVSGPDNPFTPYASFIVTKNSDGTGAPALIFTSPTSGIGAGVSWQMHLHNGYVYWLESGAVLRLSQNAAALPQTNLRITSVEVTQGIQNLSNSVRLIAGKRTVVRMHVKSDGVAVNGITAKLTRLNLAQQPIGAPLIPSNKTGEYLTVSNNPHRAQLEQSFWFELPQDWLGEGLLMMRADLNPYHYPPQASYANNSALITVGLSPSPRLEMNFVLFDYDYNGANIAAQYKRDYLQTLSWLHRAYPISDRQDNIQNAGGGLHTHYFYVHDNQLRTHLDYTSSDCPDSRDDDGGLCASDYINSYLEDIDDEDNNDAPYYGFMPSFTDKYGNKWFARGATSGDTSNGPGDPISPDSWDTDGSKSDWYAAHEIGHQMGRHHPVPASDPDLSDNIDVGCGHSDDDSDYPYSGARIGNGSLMGFDLGDPGLNPAIVMRTYDNATWTDVMSYCPSEWISDYTYEGIYNHLGPAAASSAMAARKSAANVSAALADILRIKGSILPNTQSVKWVKVQRKQGALSAAGAGDYRLRMFDAANAVLSTTVFTPTLGDDADGVPQFDLSLAYVAGVRKIDVLHAPTNKVLGTFFISANAPAVSNVHLVAPTSPLTGTAQLAWDASDADGDALKFDVYYSRDNGAHFAPVLRNVADKSAAIDTLPLGGSTTALFKVKASDGVNSGTANSPAFAMANKAPTLLITSPADGAVYNYGQVINFKTIAEDLQTDGIPDNGITWRNQYGVIGAGAAFATTDLQVGINYITVTALSATGLQASASISVEVTDNLDIAGPTLIAAPTSIGWHFDTGATTAQTATLYIDNAGAGALSWQIDNSAAWLTVSAITGTAPSTITLTADPGAFDGKKSLLTTLHITAAGQEQQVTVSAGVGNVFNAYETPATASPDRSKIFLPLTRRG